MKLNKFYNNKRVLITGHTGFKGSWLTQILKNFNSVIIGYSLIPSTNPSLFKVLNLENKIKNYVGDIRDYNNLKKVFKREKPEIIFHLAAQSTVRESYNNPLYTFETNVIGAVNVLEAARQTKTAKSIVIVTTDKVYANQEWYYGYRENDPLGGHDPYSSSKVCTETVIDSYRKSFFSSSFYGNKHNTLIASARAGNVIGGGDWTVDRLIPDLIRAVFQTKEKLIIRNPEAIRPWQHVLDPLFGYLLLAQGLYDGKKVYSGGWNFGPEDSFLTVQELLKKIFKILQQSSYSIHKDTSKHEAGLLKLDINKAKSILGWRPILSLNESIKLTVDWYRDFYSKKEIKDITNKQINLFFERLKLLA